MDFGTWSPSHTIFVAFVAAGFIGQVAIWLYRIGQTEKRMEKQGETFFHALERLEERMDKRFVEVNQQIGGLRTEVNQQIGGLRADMNQQIASVRDEIAGVRSEMNQRFSEMNQKLSDMQAEIGDVRSEMRLLNQNHIEHLTHHNR